MTEPQMSTLARSSRATAVVSAIGGLSVFAALAVGGVALWQTERHNRELARAHTQVAADKATAQAEVEDLIDRLDAAPTATACQQVQQLVAPPPPATSTRPRDRARALWRTGLAVRERNPAEARRRFQAALREDPSFAASYNSLGRLAFDDHDFARARNYYEEALRWQPDYAPARYNLAIVSAALGDLPTAEHHARALQTDHADDAVARQLGERLTRQTAAQPALPMP